MTTEQNLLYMLHEQFDNEFTKPRKQWFCEYMTICIDNEKDLIFRILNCSRRSLESAVFNAVKFQIEYLLEYYDLNPYKCHIHNDYIKGALWDYFGENYADVLNPIVDYYQEKRNELKKGA